MSGGWGVGLIFPLGLYFIKSQLSEMSAGHYPALISLNTIFLLKL